MVTCGGGIEDCRSGCLGVEELKEYISMNAVLYSLFVTKQFNIEVFSLLYSLSWKERFKDITGMIRLS